MTEVRFYHLTKRSLESALPKLLERTLDAGVRAVIVASSEERVRSLDDLLWTYDPASWLPHGTSEDGSAAEQPICITNKDENPNNSTYLFLVDGARVAEIEAYDRVFELFDGRDDEAVIEARHRWVKYKEQKGIKLAYWQEDENGKWTKTQ